MSDTRGLSTFNTVIANVLLNRGMEDRYQDMGEKLLNYCIWGMREINMHFAPQYIKVAYLTVNDNRTVKFPNDYIDYTKIGVESCGQIWTLTLNEDMLLPREDRCGQEIREVISGNGIITPETSVYYFADHYRNGNFVGRMYGLSGGFNRGYYRIDKQRRQIVLSSGIPSGTTLVLEYISSGVDATGETFIPVQYLEPLRLYCHWQLDEYDNGKQSSLSIKDRREKQFWQAVSNLEDFEFRQTGYEWMDAAYSTYGQIPKR